MNFHDFNIKLPLTRGSDFVCEMDGKPLECIESLTISAGANEVTKVSIDMFSTSTMQVAAELQLNTTAPELEHSRAGGLLMQAMDDVCFEFNPAGERDDTNDIGAVALRFVELLIEHSGERC